LYQTKTETARLKKTALIWPPVCVVRRFTISLYRLCGCDPVLIGVPGDGINTAEGGGDDKRRRSVTGADALDDDLSIFLQHPYSVLKAVII